MRKFSSALPVYFDLPTLEDFDYENLGYCIQMYLWNQTHKNRLVDYRN